MRHPVIQIVNASTVATDVWADTLAAALQIQSTYHFGPHWGIDAKVVRDPVKGAWRLVILDDSDQANALGYHDLTPGGKPQGSVFAKTDNENGLSATVTASHELLEMLLDPYINLTAIDSDSRRAYAYEACDAVEADALGYKIGNVLVSDFVLPSYFSRDLTAPFDYQGILNDPFSLARGGYMSYLTSLQGGWQQEFGRHHTGRGAERKEQRQRATDGELKRSLV